MRVRLLLLLAAASIQQGLFAQQSGPSVMNFLKQAEISAKSPIRQNAETNPDYTGKKEKPITILEVPAGGQIAPIGFKPALGPAPQKVADLPAGPQQQAVSNFAAVNDEASIGVTSGSFFRRIPPDVGGYAGPSHLVGASNNQVRITDKTGAQVSKIDLEVFWQGTPGYGITGGPAGAADPHIMYDHFSDRWFMVTQTDLNANSSLLIAVSQTNDPTGNWNRYMFKTDANSTTGFDYPQIGYTSNWIVVTGNMFPLAGGSATNYQTYIFDKANLYAGGTATIGTNVQRITTATSSFGGWGAPVTPRDNSLAANTMYIVQPFFTSGGNAVVKISSLTGTIPNVTWNNGTATFTQSPLGNYSMNSFGNFLPQRGETRGIAANDGRFSQAVMVNGRIWATHHVSPTGGVSRIAVQWWQFNTNGTVVQNGRLDDPNGQYHRTFPSLMVNAAEDVVIGYNIFSKSIYPSAAYAVRRACTPANQVAYESIYKAGVANYWKDFGGGRARWGDYSYTSIDPVTGRFWTVQEYAAARTSSSDNGSVWGTWWAEVQPQASNAVNFGRQASMASETDVNNFADCRTYREIKIPLNTTCQATGDGTVNVTVTGGTASANDYQIITPSIPFSNGEYSDSVVVRIFDDAEIESEETIILGFNVTGAGILAGTETTSHTVYITDNDVLPRAEGVIANVIGKADNTTSFVQPFRGSRWGAKTQMLYLASELTAVGVTPGNITKVGFNVTAKGTNSQYRNVTIKMKHTTLQELNTSAFETDGFTDVFAVSSYATVLGNNDFTLSTPFVWNGTDNILVEFCFAVSDLYTIPPGTADDVVASSITPVARTIWTSVSSAVESCDFITGTIFAGFNGLPILRPDIRFTANNSGTPLASNLNTITNVYLGPFADQYAYSSGGELIARIKNNTAFDYGCTQVRIDRAGTSAKAFWNNTASNFVADKTIQLIPTNNTANGQLEVTLFYKANEVSGWEAATGRTWSNIHVANTQNAVSSYTPGSVPFDQTVVNVNPLRVDFGQNKQISASFVGNRTGFAVGVPDASLPVAWLTVNGRMNNGNAIISWATAQEVNNARYEVETSRNGVDFARLGAVNGRGNSQQRNDYQYTHIRPEAGINYYRIKQVDADGKFSYSQVVALQVDAMGKGKAFVFPVPANNVLTLNMGRFVTGQVQWEIFTADMRLVGRGSSAGNLVQQQLDISKLSAGHYLLRVNTTEGVETLKFVKQ